MVMVISVSEGNLVRERVIKRENELAPKKYEWKSQGNAIEYWRNEWRKIEKSDEGVREIW